MGFHDITDHYQDQINAYKDRKVDAEMIEEIHDILEEYCTEIETTYGVNMVFELMPNPAGDNVKYEVTPSSDLDTLLLKHVIENEARVAPVSFRIQ